MYKKISAFFYFSFLVIKTLDLEMLDLDPDSMDPDLQLCCPHSLLFHPGKEGPVFTFSALQSSEMGNRGRPHRSPRSTFSYCTVLIL
jgi:hypothetical protein